jgi:succinate dehydrogenase / fumarate reductase cytochrome b subunit
MLFLAQHFFINMTSVLVPIHLILYPILWVIILSAVCYSANIDCRVIFHFIMGFVLDFKNRAARPIKYIKNNGAASSPWASRNMIVSGSVVLAFWHCIFTILGSRNGL